LSTVDPTNDKVEIFKDVDNEWRWRRVDRGNGNIVSGSGEGYADRFYASQAAKAYNSDLVREEDFVVLMEEWK
jgi:uncharacterized protein YegP (UPF0339 family)